MFLCTELTAQLVLYDLLTRKIIKIWEKRDLRLRFNEFLNYLSQSMSQQVICCSNKGNIRVLSGNWATVG